MLVLRTDPPGAMKLAQHDEAGGPIVAYAQPKLDAALGRLHALTGVQLPLDQASGDMRYCLCCWGGTSSSLSFLGQRREQEVATAPLSM